MARTNDIFVSYSSSHSELVSPLVQLLRTSGRLVFQDSSSIQPGDLWHQKILDAVTTAKTFIVIWCWHAAGSSYVLEECSLALSLKKTIVPVLIDRTPLTKELKKYQAIKMPGYTCYGKKSDGSDRNMQTQYQVQYQVPQSLDDSDSLDLRLRDLVQSRIKELDEKDLSE